MCIYKKEYITNTQNVVNFEVINNKYKLLLMEMFDIV